jgi:DNA helicase-2/ATP-dependent DNA helicase PcrA
MMVTLSEIQKKIAHEATGKIVVRACPGSGKTFSVAARIAYRVSHWGRPNQGLAAISFTNVAWQEIDQKLSSIFGLPHYPEYPHFLGTIDSFINRYIFLPHGHLLMGCKDRPVLVGEPHSNWNVKRYDKDYDQYFNLVSLGAADELIYPEIQGIFFFNYSQMYLKTGQESKHAESLRASKAKYWKQGYANQHDANYFAMKILEKYPQVARALVSRFPEIILDEAQDTSEVQMRILDLLCEQGLSQVMLVGDPDQAIFEWNNARPQLFNDKFETWKDNSIILNDNRRSSQAICDATFHLSTLHEASAAVTPEVMGFGLQPQFTVYGEGTIGQTIEQFLQKCRDLPIEINPRNVAVICRSKGLVAHILGDPAIQDWTTDYLVTYPVVHACFLFTKGLLKKAFQIAEKVIFHLVEKKDMVDTKSVEQFRNNQNFTEFRKLTYDFLKMFPPATGKLGEWVGQANREFNNALTISDQARDLQIDDLFSYLEKDNLPSDYTVGSVHAVKGETFEAVLLFLKQKGVGSYYTTMIANGTRADQEEELRIVYVGITRPRKLLVVAIPNDKHLEAWKVKLGCQ